MEAHQVENINPFLTEKTKEKKKTTAKPSGRALKLQQAFEKTLGKTLKSFSHERLTRIFPRIAKDSPEELQNAHQQTIEFLRKNIQDEFESILVSKNLIQKLTELDEMAEASKGKNTISLPQKTSISPQGAIRARTVPVKEKELQRLKEEYNMIHQENSTLMVELEKKKNELDNLLENVSRVVNDVDKAITLSSQMPIDDIWKFYEWQNGILSEIAEKHR
ncbi:uncharacterized protein VTP21DRAFT_2044 [Calcarisporiella thermophila]|uniref:uncharacterized protein n=1 Tax=Calcarisporiella thermophila TaxID=911321 RepID=UPI0037447053